MFILMKLQLEGYGLENSGVTHDHLRDRDDVDNAFGNAWTSENAKNKLF